MPSSKNTYIIEAKSQGFGKAQRQVKGLGGSMGGLMKKAGALALIYFGAKGVINGMKFATRVGKEFEQSMANLKAVSGATGSEMIKLSANAQKLGKSTKFTASQVGSLSVAYAKLGFSAGEILKVSEATLNLASATGEDLAVSAEIAGGTLRGFGLDAKKTGMVTDVMAKSFSASALDLTKFAESMKFVAPVAKTVGFSIQETTAILGKLADSSIHGSLAGTGLKNVLMQMSLPGSKLSQVFGTTVDGFDEFVDVLLQTKEAGGLTKDQMAGIPTRLQAMIPVLIESSDKLMNMKDSLDNAGGSAKRMADIQMDTLEGKMLTLNSATEGLGIAFFDTFDDILKNAVDGVTSFIGTLNEMIAIPVSEKMDEQKDRVNSLARAIQMAEKGSDTRNRIIIELNSIYPDLLQGLSDEEIAQGKLTKRLKEYNSQMIQKIAIQKADEEAKKLAEEKAEIDILVAEATIRSTDAMLKFADSFGGVFDANKSLMENYEDLNSQRDDWVDGMDLETRKLKENEDKVDASSFARSVLNQVMNDGIGTGRLLAGHYDGLNELLDEQAKLQEEVTKAEKKNIIVKETLQKMYGGTTSTPQDGQDSQESPEFEGSGTEEEYYQSLNEILIVQKKKRQELAEAIYEETQAKIQQMAIDLALKEGVDAVTEAHVNQATSMISPSDLEAVTQAMLLQREEAELSNQAKIKQTAIDLALKEGVDAVTQAHLDQAGVIVNRAGEMSGLEALKTAYEGILETMAIDREAKIQQIALDLAIKDGVDGVTQAYLDQAEALTVQQEKTQKYIDGFQEVGETVGVWADTVGGLYDAVYENKKQARDKDMAEEIKAVQEGTGTEQQKHAKIQNIKEKYDQADKDARKAMKPVKYAEAISSIALGIAKALGSAPPPFNIALAGITAGAGAVQLATISQSEYAEGGLITGNSHAQGGVNINAEGGEFMMRREAVSRIGINNLSSMNEGGGGGGAVTVNISAPLVDDTIVDVIIPKISQAVKEGRGVLIASASEF